MFQFVKALQFNDCSAFVFFIKNFVTKKAIFENENTLYKCKDKGITKHTNQKQQAVRLETYL